MLWLRFVINWGAKITWLALGWDNIVVWLDMTILLRLGELGHQSYYNKDLVKVRERLWSCLKTCIDCQLKAGNGQRSPVLMLDVLLTPMFVKKAQVQHGLCVLKKPRLIWETCRLLCFFSPVNKAGLTCIEVYAVILDSAHCQLVGVASAVSTT